MAIDDKAYKLLGSAPKYQFTDEEDGKKTTRRDALSSWLDLVEKVFPGGYVKELKNTLRIAWALVVTQMCQIYFQPVATMFGGHLGKLELDAIALSNTLINVFGNSIIIGFSTALDAAFSQTFGCGNYEMLSLYFQKGLILTVLFLLPCLAFNLNIESILIGLGQDRAVARLVGAYLLYFMPGMFCLFMWTTVRKITQCQNAVYPHIFIILIGHGVHATLQYLFLYKYGLGITGSAFAQAIVFFFLMVFTSIYTIKSATFKISWTGFDRRCLYGWGELGKLGVNGMLMVCLEWWAFEVGVILAGTLGTTELAAQSTSFNLHLMCMSIPSGLSVATSIRVGQLLGSGQAVSAKTAARVGMTISMVNGTMWMILFAAGRYQLPKLFTNDRDVIDMVAQLLPFVSAYTFADAIAYMGRGVFRGTGKHKWGTMVIFPAYYMCAIPIALCLTFLTPVGIRGLWLGFVIANYISAAVYFVILNFKLNWTKLSEEAHLRAQGLSTDLQSNKDGEMEKKALLPESEREDESLQKGTVHVVLKQGAIVTVFLLVLLAGIIIRASINHDQDELDNGATWKNTTFSYSSTGSTFYAFNSTNFHNGSII